MKLYKIKELLLGAAQVGFLVFVGSGLLLCVSVLFTDRISPLGYTLLACLVIGSAAFSIVCSLPTILTRTDSKQSRR